MSVVRVPPPRLAYVQYLRAGAALCVVLLHALNESARLGWPADSPAFLNGGVDVFFVISGFVMWISTASRPVSPLAFMRSRLLRIVPLYWVVSGFMLLVLLVRPDLLRSARLVPWHAAASFLMLPAANPATRAMQPLLIAGWTLNLEMLFYVLFAAFLAVPARWRLGGTIAALVMLVGAGQAFDLPPALAFYTQDVMLEFGYGLALGWCFRAARTVSASTAVMLLAAGCLGMVAAPSLYGDALPRCVPFGMPALLLVAGAVFLERASAPARSRMWLLLGDASYSLYLTHPIVLAALVTLWRMLRVPSRGSLVVGFALVAVPACAVVAVLVHRWVERPLMRVRHGAGWPGGRRLALPG